ncbi:MAG: MFS transporter [Chloroflexi bacterium]|nr:MFS transporter [Chloroflexota bacterium]
MTTTPTEEPKTQLLTDQSWIRPFRFIILAQFISAMGFGFSAPFLPLYVAEIGSLSNRDAALWAGIMGGINGFVLVIAGPIWGILGDWYGYKRNVLRAAFGTSLSFALIGIVRNIPQLIGARFFMGAVGGIPPRRPGTGYIIGSPGPHRLRCRHPLRHRLLR